MKSNDLAKFKLPDKPGVYFFLKGKDILYIGKATSLKDRVKSYFNPDLFNMRGPMILDMVFKADKIKWVETESVLEALILEANLIKKHQPTYNTKEKSDKSFNYVCITKEKLPKIIIVRGKNIQSTPWRRCKIYGPFPNSSQLKEALKIIRRIFPFLDEKSKNNFEFYKQIKLVPEENDYKKNIRNIKLFFEGKKKKILKNLEKEMKNYAKRHEFEKAGEIKRQIFALKHIQDVALIKTAEPDKFSPLYPQAGSDTSKIFSGSAFRVEAYDIAHTSGKSMVGVMVVLENGEPNKNEYRKFKIRNYTSSNDVGALSEVLTRRLKHAEWRMPDLIVVDGSVAQRNIALKVLREFNLKIPVSAVVKDDKHKARMILSADPRFKKQILLANTEAHRFAISYHRKLRGKSMLK